MAEEVYYSVSDLTAGTSVKGTDIFEACEYDANEPTNYKSLKKTMNMVAAFTMSQNNISSELADNTDMDTVLTPGIYSKVSGLATLSHAPSTQAAIIEVIQMASNAYYTMQRWTDVVAPTSGVPRTYVRYYRKSNTTWTGWYVYTPTAL